MDIKKEDLNQLINVEVEKVNQISLLDSSQRSVINDAVKYTVIPYMPISKPFIQKYVLNNTEYPLLEGKLSQAAIEMRSKLNCLVDTQYQYQKTQIEIARLEVEKEEIMSNSVFTEKRKTVELADKDLEIKIRNFRLASFKSSMDSVYSEFKNWAETVKECIEAIKIESALAHEKDPSIPVINDFTDIDFDKVRTAEMKIKVERWLMQEANGMELTNSQRVFTETAKMEKQVMANIEMLRDKLLTAPTSVSQKDLELLERLKKENV